MKSHPRFYTIDSIKEWARAKGGECISSEYSYKTKLLFRCAQSHEWTAEAYAIKRGRWCPRCAHHNQLGIEEMRQLAMSRGGNCLSTEYVNIETNLIWQCGKGHTWNAPPSRIKHDKHWCPVCGKQKPYYRERKKKQNNSDSQESH